MKHLRIRTVLGGALAASLLVSAVPGLAQSPAAEAPAVVTQGGTLNIDFATYNPLSLIIRDQGWLESALADQGIAVNWVQSAGSNKANEALRAAAQKVETKLRGQLPDLGALGLPGM